MSKKPDKSLETLVAEVGRYREEAFLFVRDGLNYTVEKIHGPTTPEQLRLYQFLQEKNLDLADLIEAYEAGEVDAPLASAIDAAGGFGRFNRHVGGHELCWGLRDYALEKWGLMARAVLNHWGVRSTLDFGHIVFAMVESGFMQKQPGDSIDDFRDVFDFREAFDRTTPPGPQNTG
jgi:uncharacterized repeat protein (TIGR04138 family)